MRNKQQRTITHVYVWETNGWAPSLKGAGTSEFWIRAETLIFRRSRIPIAYSEALQGDKLHRSALAS